LRQLRYAGHDVIVFHILDEAEVHFPFRGMVEFREPETDETLVLDASGMRADYLDALTQLREQLTKECRGMRVDYVPLDTSMPFDRALIEYLTQRQARF
ncbi:MAG: DUF58 domain-containing protein, partial [Planctomycetaceae bacterium]